MIYFKLVILSFCLSLSLVAEAKLLEDLMDKSHSKSSLSDKGETIGLKDKVKNGINDVKEQVQSWIKTFAPKSQEEMDREKRVQAELERQRRVQDEMNERSQALPSFESQERKQFKNFVDSAAQQIKNLDPLSVQSSAVLPDPSLPKTQRGVPYVNISPVEKLNKLNIGTEPVMTFQKLSLNDFVLGVDKFKMSSPLKGPNPISQREIDRWTSKKIDKALSEKILARKDYDLREVVTEEKIQKLTVVTKETEDIYKEYKKFSKSDLKLLAALILNKNGDKCHLVVGLFDDLSKKPKYKIESDYHLGICSIEMGFHSEAVERLLPLIKLESPYFSPKALVELSKKLPREFEVPFYEVVNNLKSPDLIKATQVDSVSYAAAKGAYKKEKYNQAITFASRIDAKSNLYPSAQFVIATSHYLLKNKTLAISTYKSLETLLEQSSDDNLKNLVTINLARIHFQTDKYTDALQYYLKIKKNHPLWVQGLIEQGWAQIMVGDYSGAIGNMYSLHSPYFKSVYMPESWAVRSIGYLNICQYGDAYSSLTKLEKNYGDWYRAVESYIKNNKTGENYYSTVTGYLKGKSDQNHSGLPFQVIREMARQRTYLNYQDSINLKVDELTQYDFIKSLIDKDIFNMKDRIVKAKARIDKLNADIKKAETAKQNLGNLTELTQQINFEKELIKKLNFQLPAYQQ